MNKLCKLCGISEKQLVNAHIIPRGLHKQLCMVGEESGIRLGSPGKYHKKSPIGVWDDTILCAGCDNSFSLWEKYSCEFLLSPINENTLINDLIGHKLAYRVDRFEYDKLQLFFLSLLWKASITKKEEFNTVNLGPYETVMKDIILSGDINKASQFSILFRRLLKGPNMHLFPAFFRKEGVNFFHLYLGEFEVWIKVDKQKLPKTLEGFVLKPQKPLWILLRNFSGSNIENTVKSINLKH